VQSASAAILVAGTLVLGGCTKPNDADVIDAVLKHFTVRTDIQTTSPDGVTLVAQETEWWSEDRFNGFTLNRQSDSCELPPGLLERYFERNAKSTSSDALVTPQRKWRLVTTQELDGFTYGVPTQTPSGEDIRTLVSLSYPAYSPNGDTAFLMLGFTWSVHSAIAQYVMTRSDDEWVVQCSRLHFYV
jgi:hypothetical protein